MSLKRIILVLLCTVTVFNVVVLAEENTEPVITSDYACVYNVESGEMLYEKGANTIIYPGSLVKIVTSVMALEYYEQHKNENIEITVSETALETLQGNNIKLKAGETASFYDLVAAVAVGGANDAALVLAETVSGSVDKFVKAMNDKAKELGAFNTQFANPTGFHSPMTYSTLSDLALICEWANKNNAFMELSSSVKYVMPATNFSKERTFVNSNLLLDPTHWLRHYKEGTSGMNAGMTNQAGYTLATVYNNDGQTNIVIIVGGKIDGWDYHYFNDVSNLIDFTSVNYEYKNLVSRDNPVHDMKVLYGKDTDHVLLTTKNEVTALLPHDALDEDITTDYTLYSEKAVAPIKKGQKFGTMNVYYKGELVGEVDLVTQSNIKCDYFLYLSGILANFFKKEIVKSSVLFLFSSALFVLTISSVVRYRKKKKRLELERAQRRRNLNRARRTIK